MHPQRGRSSTRLAEDLAEGGHHDQVGRPGAQLLLGFGLAQPLRLDDFDAKRKGERFDRRRGELTPAPGRPVGLGDHADHVVAGCQACKDGKAKSGEPMKTIFKSIGRNCNTCINRWSFYGCTFY